MSCTDSSDDEADYLVVIRHNNAGATNVAHTPSLNQSNAAGDNGLQQEQVDDVVVAQDDMDHDHLDVELDLEGDNVSVDDVEEVLEDGPIVIDSEEEVLEGELAEIVEDSVNEPSILESTIEAEPNETTDESRYESAADMLTTAPRPLSTICGIRILVI